MAEPVVSVLTAVRNGERYIAETISSVRSQSFADWEHVIVDDASDDGTADVVSRLAREDPRVRLVRREVAGGPYVAANTGLAEVRGRYVARIDGDDVAMPDRLALQVAFLDAEPGLEAATGSWEVIDAAGLLEGGVRSAPSRSPRVLRWSVSVIGALVHSTLFVRREPLIARGGYVEMPTSADLHLWCALLRDGVLGVMPDVLVRWRRHAAQIGSDRADVQRQNSIGVLAEHMLELTGERWNLDDIRALRATGRWERTGPVHGFRMLSRWQHAWMADPSLDDDDRTELRAIARRVRMRHLRTSAASAVGARRGGD